MSKFFKNLFRTSQTKEAASNQLKAEQEASKQLASNLERDRGIREEEKRQKEKREEEKGEVKVKSGMGWGGLNAAVIDYDQKNSGKVLAEIEAREKFEKESQEREKARIKEAGGSVFGMNDLVRKAHEMETKQSYNYSQDPQGSAINPTVAKVKAETEKTKGS
ncbi:MAG: hypothetical protein V4694_00020 [Pseudomonadota bacterium]